MKLCWLNKLWRIIQDPNSMIAKELKAKYFPNVIAVRAAVGYNPSYTWRSIHHS
ncbi:ribonuclease H, partial [Trifolium medium]|nr:ribonuclease H [Trifolium medium]